VSTRSPEEPEFSRLIAAETVSNHPQRREIAAEPGERQALARRFGLLSLDKLAASLELHRQAGEVIRIHGHLVADVVQSCVVTLAPVPAHLETEFELSYGASADEEEAGVLDPIGPDAPEPLVEGQIDLGEALAQQLAVALDPYPRAPGASLALERFTAEAGKTPGKQPFAALAEFKKRP
jgi:uncharacterized metal-binding protein YceD (DUF177 family)